MILAYSLGNVLGCRAYTKGLQHNYELKNNIPPKVESNPITQVIEKYQEKQQEKEEKTIMDEWLNGE
jgi:hypothetical protein